MAGLYRVFWIQDHTLTMDIEGIHNVLSIDRVILERTHHEAKSAFGITQEEQTDGSAVAENGPALSE